MTLVACPWYLRQTAKYGQLQQLLTMLKVAKLACGISWGIKYTAVKGGDFKLEYDSVLSELKH